MALSESKLTQPQRVGLAVNLLYLSLGLRMVEWTVLLRPGLRDLGVEVLTRIVPLAIITYLISKGKNWARIIFLVVFLLLVPLRVFNLIKIWTANPLFVSLYFIYYLMQVVALLMIFQKQSTVWFYKATAIRSLSVTNLSMPRRVQSAIILLYISVAIYIFWVVDVIADITLGIIKLPPKIAFHNLLEGYVLSALLSIFLTYMLGRRKRWARVSILVLFILTIIGSIVISFGGFSAIVVNYVGFYLAILVSIALVFLFRKDSNDWFRRSPPIVQPAKPADAS